MLSRIEHEFFYNLGPNFFFFELIFFLYNHISSLSGLLKTKKVLSEGNLKRRAERLAAAELECAPLGRQHLRYLFVSH